VVRGDADWHLKLTRDGLIFECIALYRDFRQSYKRYAKQHILHRSADAQRRLDKLTEHDHLKVHLIERLPPERWSLTDVDVRSTSVVQVQATPLLLRFPT
jgi:hypothetical protein